MIKEAARQQDNTKADEQELVAAVLRRDRKATAEFVSRFADPVYSYVHWRLTPALGEVDDVVQEVFLDAWQGLKRYRGDSGLAAWILGIARHKVQDHYRRALKDFDPIDATDEPLEMPRIEEAVFERQREDRIQAVLAQLPASYRTVLLWRYWDGQSAAEIALSIGRTDKAVERLLARAREQFRGKYSE